jgi:signal transduction histidine kinase
LTATTDHRRLQLLVATVALVLTLCAGVWVLSRPAPVPAGSVAFHLEQALRSAGSPDWSAARPAGESVSLPDVWRRQTPKVSGIQSYHFLLPAARWSGPSAIYIPRLGNRARVWLDGELLASFGDVDSGQQDFTPRPLLVTVQLAAASALSVDRATTPNSPRHLVIEVAGSATRFSGLSDVWWGPAVELEMRHAARDALLLTSAGLAGGGSLLLGSMGLGLAVWRRNALLVFFGVAGLAAGTRALLWIWREPGIPYTAWYASMDACFGLWACCIAWFALRVADIRLPVLEWGLRGLMALMVPATVMAALDISTRPKEIWLDLTLVLAAAITLILVGRAWRRPDGVSIALALGAVTVVTLSGVDHWNIFFSPDAAAYTRPYFSHHMALLFGVFMAASLAARFDQAVRAEQDLRRGLADEVRAQRQELETLYARERQRLESQATQRERQRIMQDMHDGLGAHLTGLLTMVQRGAVTPADLEREVAEALDHLRMTVDTAGLDGATVTDVLAQLRFRLEPRLRKTGLVVQWVLDDLPGALSVEQASHLQKLVLEALSNAMRHAQAQTVVVEAIVVGAARRVQIRDDGRVVWQPDVVPQLSGHHGGQGLASMRARAQALGAELSVSVGVAGGTVVSLLWP